jgi:hypothetical protein
MGQGKPSDENDAGGEKFVYLSEIEPVAQWYNLNAYLFLRVLKKVFDLPRYHLPLQSHTDIMHPQGEFWKNLEHSLWQHFSPYRLNEPQS